MTYPGGKSGSGVFQFIINQIPPHRLYIEGFLGGGAIMRNKRPAEFNVGIDRDPQAISAFQQKDGFDFIEGEFIDILARIDKSNYASAEIFIYLDPPYLMETRKSQAPLYNFEMTHQEHEQLLELIKDRNEMIMISGYKSDLYDKQLAGWRLETFNSVTRSGAVAREHLWMNYPEPTQLHDYSFLGDDFTDRQRIKRKIARLIKKLAALPPLERAALIAAFEDRQNQL